MEEDSNMKTIDNAQRWSFYIWWLFSAAVSLWIALTLAMVIDPLFTRVIGEFIQVGGQSHITEDYMLIYGFIPTFGLVLGVQQYFMLRFRLAKMGWWILTAALGWALAWLGISLRSMPLENIVIPHSTGYAMATGAALGILIGLAQWLLLRGRLNGAGWWIPANMFGFGIAGLLFSDFSSMAMGMAAVSIPSILTGAVLWFLLDRSRREPSSYILESQESQEKV
jgi:hypothetical protein